VLALLYGGCHCCLHISHNHNNVPFVVFFDLVICFGGFLDVRIFFASGMKAQLKCKCFYLSMSFFSSRVTGNSGKRR
jgi:hypothetical protein